VTDGGVGSDDWLGISLFAVTRCILQRGSDSFDCSNKSHDQNHCKDRQGEVQHAYEKREGLGDDFHKVCCAAPKQLLRLTFKMSHEARRAELALTAGSAFSWRRGLDSNPKLAQRMNNTPNEHYLAEERKEHGHSLLPATSFFRTFI
jgi:hypothetical protein